MKIELEWVRTSERLPERRLDKRYSQVPCLVVKDNYIELLVFNHEHNCWDDSDGDDYRCEIRDVKYWMELPKQPNE